MDISKVTAGLISIGYTLLIIHAVRSENPASQDLVTAFAVLFLVVSAGIWFLPDEVIKKYQMDSEVYNRVQVTNVLIQCAVLFWAGWSITLFIRALTVANEIVREIKAEQTL